MPDLRYRIKKVSEQKSSIYDYDSLPPNVLSDMRKNNTFFETDRNIKPHTCAYVSRVMWDNRPLYLCGIKHLARRHDLISSDMLEQPRDSLLKRLVELQRLRDAHERNKPAYIQGLTNQKQTALDDADKIEDLQKRQRAKTSIENQYQSLIDDANEYTEDLDKAIKEIQDAFERLRGSSNPEREDEHRVSGALELTQKFKVWNEETEEYEDVYFVATHFECMHCNMYTGASKFTESGFSTQDVTYPRCNCYTPRGGMTVSHFDGAVKTSVAPGYVSSAELPNAYDAWEDEDTTKYPSAIPTRYPAASDKLPERPPQLGFTYMILNLRARIAPCCWWARGAPLIYKEEYFRVIDLAVAKAKAKEDTNVPEMSSSLGVSDIADYVYREGDYPFEGVGDLAGESAVKRALLGRNYDWSLPETGNNRRIIYALDPYITGELVREVRQEDLNECGDFSGMWHFDSELWFSPANCGHPDCKVRYEWGAVCNGGGAFSLADGRACPYYEHPLMGPEVESKRVCRLSRMYAGDYVTGEAILELMWLSKGGMPWTKEEWESVWQVPYIWTTVPFSPVTVITNKWTNEHGKTIVTDMMRNEYHMYGKKAEIDLTTGKMKPPKKAPPVLLPGGTVTAHKRAATTNKLEKADRIPDFPTLVKELEANALGHLRIIWPAADLEAITIDYTDSESYLQALKESKSKVYTKLAWDRDGMTTDIIGSAPVGTFTSGVYCVNMSFLTGTGQAKDKRQDNGQDNGGGELKWQDKDGEELKEILEKFKKTTSKGQWLLRRLWKALVMSQLPDKESILKGMPLLKANVETTSTFKFDKVPLNALFDENFILVFGYNSEGTIDASFVKVKPVFRRAYVYQASTSLMTSWKTVWNGRPSLFLNMSKLNLLGGATQESEVTLNSEAITITDYSDPGVTVEDLNDKIDALELEITALKNLIEERLKELNTLQSTGHIDAAEKLNEIKTLEAQLAAKKNQKQELINQRTQRLEAEGAQEAADRSKIEQLQLEIESLEKQIVLLQEELYNILVSSKGKAPRSQTDPLKEQILAKEDLKASKEQELAELQAAAEVEEKETDVAPDDVEEEAELFDTEFIQGDPDNQELQLSKSTNQYEITPSATSRLYVPFLNADESTWRDIDQYQRVDGHADPPVEPVTLDIPEESGKVDWDYMTVGPHKDVSARYTYGSKAAKRVVVYSSRDSDLGQSNEFPGVELTDRIGKWYPLSACSSMIVLVLNPEIFNNHTEAMIFSLSAEAEYKWKNQDGEETTLKRKLKFAPVHYCQVPHSFPGWVDGRYASIAGNTTAHGATLAKVEVSEDVEMLERESIGRHPWIYFAEPVDDDTSVLEWHHYNGQWTPDIPGRVNSILPDKDDVTLYIEFAYIAEVYDHNDKDMTDWDLSSSSSIAFNHPKAGIQRTIFYYDGEVDGFSEVPIGSHTVATLWPHARVSCRDYEIKYIWRDELKNVQKAQRPRKGANDTCYGPAKRYTTYALGDHDLGTEFQQAVNYLERKDIFDSLSFDDNMGFRLEGKDPMAGFPETYGSLYAAGEKQGSLYYPYTRSEPMTLYYPQHKTFPWEFMLTWRNKYRQENAGEGPPLGKGRMLGPKYCNIGTYTLNRGKSDWYQHWEYDPKGKRTQFLGKSQTRGPVYQLEYREYFDLERKTVYLKPYVARSNYTRDAQWMVLLDKLIPSDEELVDPSDVVNDDPTASDLSHEDWKLRVRQNWQAWSVRVNNRAFYTHYGEGDYSQYESELNRLYDYGQRRGWEFTYPLDSYKLEFSTTFADAPEGDECCDATDILCQSENPTWPICDDCELTESEKKEVSELQDIILECNRKLNTADSLTNPLTWDERQQLKETKYQSEYRVAYLLCQDLPTKPEDPDTITRAEWERIMMVLWNHWKLTGSGRNDVMVEINRGYEMGWYVSIDWDNKSLEFTDLVTEEDYADCQEEKAGIALKMVSIKAEIDMFIAVAQEAISIEGRARHLKKVRDLTAAYSKYKEQYNEIECDGPTFVPDEEDVAISQASATTNMLTGCTRADELARAIDEAGSFMILDDYIPGSISSIAELEKREEEKNKIYRKLQRESNRYYTYEQKPFGYNYPWSPYDSPPLFGNTGREMYVLELCTLGSVISWLPRTEDAETETPTRMVPSSEGHSNVEDDPEVEPSEPPSPTFTSSTYSNNPSTKTPSWWSGWSPEGRAKEMTVLLAPPAECTRAVTPLASEAINPFYNYVFDNPLMTEGLPSSSSELKPHEIRIVTKHDVDHYGEPGYRSDVGRFTLLLEGNSDLTNIRVMGDTPSLLDYCYGYEEEDADLTLPDGADSRDPDAPCSDGSMPPCDDPCGDTPDCDESASSQKSDALTSNDIDGSTIKGLAYRDGTLISVGERYPGFCGSYDYSRFFVGYTKQGYDFIHWAWPRSNKDYLERGIRVSKWWGVPSFDDSNKYLVYSKEGKRLAAIPSIECGPYTYKQFVVDDGREISTGPELKDQKNQAPLQREKSYKEVYYAIVVESERIHNNTLRPPLIWAEEIDNPAEAEVGHFKAPSEGVPVHQATEDGGLLPSRMYGTVDEKSVFSTGAVTLDANLIQENPLPNMLVSDRMNDAGVYPGFVVPSVNYRFLGKVFNNRVFKDELSEIKLARGIDTKGTRSNSLTCEIYLKRFDGNAMFIDVIFDEFFTEGNLEKYFSSVTDRIVAKIEVTGSSPTGDTMYKRYMQPMPMSKSIYPHSDITDVGSTVIDLDFSITSDLLVKITFLVETDYNNFLYNKKAPWGVDRPKVREVWDNQKKQHVKVEDPLEEVFASCVIKEIHLCSLTSGKCAEVIKISEVGFVVSYGRACDNDGSTYNFFDECKTDWFKCQWEEAEKEVNRNEGWWTKYVGGRSAGLIEGDGKQGSSLEGTPVSDDEHYVSGSMNDMVRKTDSSFNKSIKAQAYPDRCLELPELPQSRLKIEAWNNLNGGVDGEESNQIPDGKWTHGGVWTTRMSGPEWRTADPNPTRDFIWWPALPYYSGRVVMKGRYFAFGPQYKDEAKVMDEAKKPDPDDEYNKHANVYELRGFDALLRVIQEWETQTADQRKNAYHRGQKYNRDMSSEARANNPMVDALDRSAVNDLGLGRSASWSAAGATAGGHVGLARSAQGSMASSAVQGILQAEVRNYTVFDRREYVYIDEVGISPTLKEWEELEEMELQQKYLYEDAVSIDSHLFGYISMTAIIPVQDWLEIQEITGKTYQDLNPDAETDNDPISLESLRNTTGACSVYWKDWSWAEVDSFTFRKESTVKFPENRRQNDWSDILTRECGNRWKHDSSQNVIQEDCADVHNIGLAGKCSDSATKWTKEELGWASTRVDGGLVEYWPSTVSDDQGGTLKQPDPWWRY